MSSEENFLDTNKVFVDTPENRDNYPIDEVSDEDVDKTALDASGERAPNTPRIKEWFLKKEGKTDKDRGDAERGKK